MEQKRFDLLVFDWDGTLMDSAARIVASLRASIADLNWEPRESAALKNIIGLGLQEAIRALYPQVDANGYAGFVERYRYHFLVANTTPSELFPGAADTVRDLDRRGYLLAVATGKGRQGLNRVLEETGLRGVFRATRCADETASKPHPQMLRELMAELDASPARTLMMETPSTIWKWRATRERLHSRFVMACTSRNGWRDTDPYTKLTISAS